MSTQPPSQSPQRRKPRLHPQFYIKRATGEFVPLVPVDELPVDFYGLPKSMGYVDNARMAFLGVKGPRTGVYRVKLPKLNVVTTTRREAVHEEDQMVGKSPPTALPTQVKQISDTKTSSSPAPTELDAKPAASPSQTPATPNTGPSISAAPSTKPPPSTIQLNTIPATVATAPAPSPATPAPASPAQQQPELCHNWILGFCKWTPHCRRTHAMPATIEELRAIVLRRQPYRPGTHHVPVPAQVQQQQVHPAEVLRSYALQREMAQYAHAFRGRGMVGRQAPSARARVVEAQLRRNPAEGEAIARRDAERELRGMEQERVEGEGAAAEQMKRVPTGQLVDVQ